MALIKKFTDTLDDGISNAEWDRYDGTIKLETETYNTRFAQTPGFKRFNWLVFKAVVWIESGGPKVWKGKLVLDNKIWTSMPMQIGNAGDAGRAERSHQYHHVGGSEAETSHGTNQPDRQHSGRDGVSGEPAFRE